MLLPRILRPAHWPTWARNLFYGTLGFLGTTALLVLVGAALQGRLFHACRYCLGKGRFAYLTIIIPRVAKKDLPPEMPPGYLFVEQEYLWCGLCLDGYNGVFEDQQEPVELPGLKEYFSHKDSRVA